MALSDWAIILYFLWTMNYSPVTQYSLASKLLAKRSHCFSKLTVERWQNVILEYNQICWRSNIKSVIDPSDLWFSNPMPLSLNHTHKHFQQFQQPTLCSAEFLCSRYCNKYKRHKISCFDNTNIQKTIPLGLHCWYQKTEVL